MREIALQLILAVPGFAAAAVLIIDAVRRRIPRPAPDEAQKPQQP